MHDAADWRARTGRRLTLAAVRSPIWHTIRCVAAAEVQGLTEFHPGMAI
jgi:hypothetical protein